MSDLLSLFKKNIGLELEGTGRRRNPKDMVDVLGVLAHSCWIWISGSGYLRCNAYKDTHIMSRTRYFTMYQIHSRANIDVCEAA